MAKTPMKELYDKVLVLLLDVSKAGACVSACMSAFCRHIVHDSSRSRLGKKALRAAGKACASVKPAVFTHISFAMCWRWDRVSKRYSSAIVIDARTEGSKGVGHGSAEAGA